tara:strand:+ start:2238 stop:2465 length:228 start_codon:yes stop_codon:yes gene_type:complete
MKNEIPANMLSTVIKELEAIEAKATTTIQIILFNSAGNDHANFLDEIIAWSQKGVMAKRSKEFLLSKFTAPLEKE